MALTYYNARNSITQSPNLDWKDDLQRFVDFEFENAGNLYDISKVKADKTFESLTVRLTFPYSISAQSTIKDDFKTILFKDLQYNVVLGEMWNFNSYYWMTIDTGRNKSNTASCMIQRCNDSLRFYDETGKYHDLPCIVNKNSIYDLDNDRIMALPMNQTRVLVKWDSESTLIKWADVNSSEQKYTRFILNGYAFRTVSIDRTSYIRNGNGYIDVRLVSDMIKPTDDLVNGIADNSTNDAIVTILNGNSTINVGQTLQLNTIVTTNGVEVQNPNITYTSNNTAVATVSSSGLVTGISSSGTPVVITATYGNKTTTINLTVTNVVTNNYTLDFTASSGNIQTIKLNQTNSYTVNALNNGVVYADTITFNVTDDTGLMPSGAVTIVSTVGNIITLKANNVNANVGQYFRLYAVGSNKTDYIRVQIKSIF